MTGRLAGKVALISGSARGQGATEAAMFVREGACVVVSDVLDDLGRATAASLGDRACYVHLDVTDDDQWRRAVDEAERTFGHLDVLVNNAGIFPQVPMMKMTPELFDQVYRVNLRGLAFASQAAAKQMIEQKNGGSIVNIGSIDSLHPSMVGLAAYDASKGGVLMFTRNFALEAAPYGIRVNAVLPGGVTTEGTSVPLAGSGMSDAEMKAMITQFTSRIPLRRMGVPDDIAKAVVFFASAASDYVTGASLVVDGGRLLS